MAFSRFSWWLWGGKERENEKDKDKVSNESSINSYSDWGLGFMEPDKGKMKFQSVKTTTTSRRKVKRKWQSRDEKRRIDKEYDVVLVPSDGVGLSGSESDDSDWSIGWLEQHAPDFQGDDEVDNSFAVLVPCYRHDSKEMEEEMNNQFLSAINNFQNEYSNEGKKYAEHWLSNFQNC